MTSKSTLAIAMGEIQVLKELEERAEQLRQKGDHLNALKCMERILLLRQDAYGFKSYEVKSACIATGEYCNMLAMKCLQEDNFVVCQKLLKKASSLASSSIELQVATYNNFACLFRKQNKLRMALDFLMKAIHLEAQLEHAPTAAETHLNACAVLSQLGRHAKALEHAQAALILLQEQHTNVASAVESSKDVEEGEKEAKGTGESDDKEQVEKDEKREEVVVVAPDRAIVLSVAHHNIGVELEYLGKFTESLAAYRKAVSVATKYLGEAHPVTESLEKAVQIAVDAVATKRAPYSPKKKDVSSKKAAKCYKSSTMITHIGPKPTKKHVGSVRSPTKRGEKRFDSAYSAYGRISGVTPVRAGVVHKTKATKELYSEPKELDTEHFDEEVLSDSFTPSESTSTVSKKLVEESKPVLIVEKVNEMMSPRVPEPVGNTQETSTEEKAQEVPKQTKEPTQVQETEEKVQQPTIQAAEAKEHTALVIEEKVIAKPAPKETKNEEQVPATPKEAAEVKEQASIKDVEEEVKQEIPMKTEEDNEKAPAKEADKPNEAPTKEIDEGKSSGAQELDEEKSLEETKKCSEEVQDDKE